MLRNSVWLLIGRLSARGMGLVSTLIMSRLLAPDDYGVIAACVIVQEFASRMQRFGIEQNLITSPNLTPHLIHSALMLRIGMGLLASVTVYALAYGAGPALGDMRIGPVLQVIGWSFLIQSAANINVALQAKRENFTPDVLTVLLSKSVGISVTLVWAWGWNANYWALAAGIVASELAYTVLSYVLAKPIFPDPRLITKVDLRQLAGFSKWIFLRENLDFANAQMLPVAVQRLFGSANLGLYSMSSSLSSIYASEVSAAVDKSALSHLSAKLAESPLEERPLVIARDLNYMLDLKHLLITPVYICVAAFPELFVQVLLGPKWLSIAPFLTAMAINWILIGYTYSVVTVHIGLRQPRVIFYNALVQLFVRALALALAAYAGSIFGLVWGGVVVTGLALLLLWQSLRHQLDGTLAFRMIWVGLYHASKIGACIGLAFWINTRSIIGLAVLALILLLVLPLEQRWSSSQAYLDVFHGLGRYLQRLRPTSP